MHHIGLLKVKDIMQKLKAVKPTTEIPELIRIFEKEKTDALAVVSEKNNFLGDVHKHDLLKLIVDPKDLSWDEVVGIFGREVDMGYFAKTAVDLMHRHELSVSPPDLVKDVVELMFRHDVDVIAVVEKSKLVGMVTELEILDEIYRINKRGGSAKK